MKKAYGNVEKGLIEDILKGNPHQGEPLQSERDLAARFGVSRLVVREALQRLSETGWISVRQRHATIVNDYWNTGNLDLLLTIAKNVDQFPLDIVEQLLDLRVELAPAYVRRAVQNESSQVIACLAKARKLNNTPSAFAKFDWELHRTMAILSGNRIYPLLLNSFSSLYFKLRGRFFANETFREMARNYYQKLMRAAINENAEEAAEVTRSAMLQRLHVFRQQIAEEKDAKGQS